ncbi:MAG TPA: nucleoside triphosphate pyrophosphohydrolase [Cellvibrionaceae bacterium]|nr:nucleoside triphosphate pyrophosphohydrolase [Cellvibrionaceae bacterium]HMW71061.1 nucleoside triphosphate pyrophosphohydrolase [Cellvibrionaceae bacterium]HMY37883.1 nucleoside triphosphate pyrophosphohydrolase [Marinagarivorans sp.]HNG60272.1 nucleoside triphosphate pyrophosphohydrolase [Cellvibrionaceae bacterium]
MPHYTLADLIQLMARLRDPADGCPWDLKQSFSSITKHTLEEVYEVIDAIERQDLPQLRDELGDLLFQIVFYAQLAQEQGAFDFAAVVDGITQKLLRRHPHVFPDGSLASRRQSAELTDAAIKAQWEQIKSQERGEKGQPQVLADIPAALPGLIRAEKLQKRVAVLGMDFADARAAIAGVKAEINELEAALATQQVDAVADELGDVLFSLVNVSRHLKLDAEQCLRAANSKFSRRVVAMDKLIAERRAHWDDFDSEAFAVLWQQAKTVSD